MSSRASSSWAENVRISEVAISQGNLTIRITETPQVSQPQPFAPDSATTEVVPRTSIDVEESGVKKLTIVPSGVTLQELVEGLNALGVGPRDHDVHPADHQGGRRAAG